MVTQEKEFIKALNKTMSQHQMVPISSATAKQLPLKKKTKKQRPAQKEVSPMTESVAEEPLDKATLPKSL